MSYVVLAPRAHGCVCFPRRVANVIHWNPRPQGFITLYYITRLSGSTSSIIHTIGGVGSRPRSGRSNNNASIS